MKKIMMAVLVSLLVVNVAYSANLKSNCGCGLGSMFFEGQDGTLTHTAAAITNGFFGNQTFGISSGTLGCERPQKWVENEKLNQFVSENMDNLAVDIASGKGESLDTLAEIIQVPADRREKLYSALQNNFDEIYPSAKVTHEQVIKKIAVIAQKI